jgi:hypothetical protein
MKVSFASTLFREDFLDYQRGNLGCVNTIAGATPIKGFGIVEWREISESGQETSIHIPCHHVPDAKVCLLSPIFASTTALTTPPINLQVIHPTSVCTWITKRIASNVRLICNLTFPLRLLIAIATHHPLSSPAHGQNMVSAHVILVDTVTSLWLMKPTRILHQRRTHYLPDIGKLVT